MTPRADPAMWDERNFECGLCGAQPGEACVSSTGGHASPHVSRVSAANRVWLREHPALARRISGDAIKEDE